MKVIERILVFENHPEFFFHNYGMKEAVTMDARLKIAT